MLTNFLDETLQFIKCHTKSEDDILYVAAEVVEFKDVKLPNRKRLKRISEKKIYTCTWEEFKECISGIEYNNTPGYGYNGASQTLMGVNNELFIVSKDGWFMRRTQWCGCNENHNCWTMHEVPSQKFSAGKLCIDHVHVMRQYDSKDTDYRY